MQNSLPAGGVPLRDQYGIAKPDCLPWIRQYVCYCQGRIQPVGLTVFQKLKIQKWNYGELTTCMYIIDVRASHYKIHLSLFITVSGYKY